MSVIRKVQVRRGTAAAWSSANPVLSSGEFGYDTTNGELKIGDGSTAWSSLPAKQDALSRDPVGDYGTFGIISMRETASKPRGPNSLTSEQQLTYERAYGIAGTVTTNTSDGGTYYDNYMIIGFNPHETVYNEGSIRLTFESEWTNTGLDSEKVMEWHIDGKTREGTYMRPLTGTIPKGDSQNKDDTLAIEASVQLFNFADKDGNGIFNLDARGGSRRAVVPQGVTLDIRGVSPRKNIRQLIDATTSLWAFLPYADYPASEVVIRSDYPLLVNGRIIAEGRVSGTEYWINGLNYLQVGKACSSGLVHGYNIDSISSSPRYAENGNAAGIWSIINTIRFYATASGTKGNNLPSWGMACSHTTVEDEMYLELLHPRTGTVKRVTAGAADSGGTGFRLLRIAN